MNKLTNKEKIEKLRNLYNEFNSKIIILKRKQLKLLEKARKLVEEKKLKEVRDKIKK